MGCVVCGAVFALYQIKYRVQTVEAQIAAVERELAEEQEVMHVLTAEWHYLNRPSRLAMLVKRQKQEALVPVSAKQVATVENIPFAPSDTANAEVMLSGWSAEEGR